MTSSQSTISRIQSDSDSSDFRLIGHNDLNGFGDGMQVIKRGDFVYVAHVGYTDYALSVLDCSDPSSPVIVRQFKHPPNTHRHKVQIAGDILVQNSERPPHIPEVTSGPEAITGMYVYDLSEDPTDPRKVGFFPAGGKGVHRIWFVDGRYAHIATYPASPSPRESDLVGSSRVYQIVDLTDPTEPTLVGQWHIPGTLPDDENPWSLLGPQGRFGLHGVIANGNLAYASCLDAGMAILDISTLSAPTELGHISWAPPYGGFTHTTLPLPGRGVAISADEALPPNIHTGDKRIWVVDVRDPRQPVTIATFPEPTPPKTSRWDSYHEAPGRFGPHNLHENQPGSFSSESVIFATFYSGGLRLYDLRDTFRPEEIAHWVPPPPPGRDATDINDLFVAADGLIYVTERHGGGLYVLEYDGNLR